MVRQAHHERMFFIPGGAQPRMETAQKDMRRLTARIHGQVERTIDRIRERYRHGQPGHDSRPLIGMEHSYRVDTGEYRVLYTADHAAGIIRLWRVGHRRDVYRGL